MFGFAARNPGAAPLAFLEGWAVISARWWSRVFHAASYKIAGSEIYANDAKPFRKRQQRAAALSGRGQRRSSGAPAWLRRNEPHVAPADGRTRKHPHRNSRGFARSRSVLHPTRWLHQGCNGAGHPRARTQTWSRTHSYCRARHRVDGCVRLRGAVSERGGSDCVNGRLLAGRRKLARRMADAGSLAFSFLWQDAPRARTRSRTHLFRAFLERFRRRLYPFSAGARPSDLR